MLAVCLKTNFSVNLNRVESWKWPNGLCLRSTCPASAMIKCPPLLKAQTCIMQINLGPQSIMNHSCFSGEEGLRMASLEKRRAQAGQNVHCTMHCLFLTDALTKCCCIYLDHVVILSTLKLDSGLGLTAREGCSFLKKKSGVCSLHIAQPYIHIDPYWKSCLPNPFFGWQLSWLWKPWLYWLERHLPALKNTCVSYRKGRKEITATNWTNLSSQKKYNCIN